jgi:hypothetical protein
MIENALKCLGEFDFFGKFYYFTFNKKTRYTSSCGGILSLFVIIGFLLAVWFLGKEIIFKTSPILVYNYSLDSLRYNRPLKVPFGIVIESIDGQVLENFEKYFTFSASYINFSKINYTQEFTIIKKEIPMRHCKQSDFSDDFGIQNTFMNNNLTNGFCMDYMIDTIGGCWGNLWNYYTNITIEPCVNKTSNLNSCASLEEIRYFIVHKQIQVSIYYEDMILTATNNEKPLTKYMKNEHHRIQSNTVKTNEYFLQDVVITTDNGWTVPSKNILTTQVLTNRFYDFYNNNIQSMNSSERDTNKIDAAVSFNIFASQNKYEIFRSYLKVQDILAQLGGVLKVVFILIEALLYLVYTHKHEEVLIKKLYAIKSSSKEDQNYGKNIYLTHFNVKSTLTNDNNKATFNGVKRDENMLHYSVEKFNLNASNQLILNLNNELGQKRITSEENIELKTSNIYNTETIKKDAIECLYKDLFEKKKNFDGNKINFSYFEVFMLVYCKCFIKTELEKKETIFRNLVEYTKKYSDGMRIIKTISEFEKLKNLLFDEKQSALFSLLSHPTNPFDTPKGDLKLFSSIRTKSGMYEMARNYVNELKNKRNFSFIEKGLIDLNNK